LAVFLAARTILSCNRGFCRPSAAEWDLRPRETAGSFGEWDVGRASENATGKNFREWQPS
jgi:hypothetical protein